MKILHMLAVLALATLVSSFKEEWEMFKNEHKKSYASKEEENKRFKIFKDNMKKINRHNFEADLNKHTFRVGINHHADLSVDERREKLKGFKPPANVESFDPSSSSCNNNNHTTPTTLDWRTKGYVTPVKNQGQCGSCYSFAAAAVLEGLYYKQTGQSVSFSEEILMNCSPGVYKCSGGWYARCFQFVQGKGRIGTLTSYPYNAQAGSCMYSNAGTLPIKISSMPYVTKGDENALKTAVTQHGPTAVAIDAEGMFDFYRSGVYTSQTCSQRANHAVTLVGYGTSNNQDYWLIKNSWGTYWGQQGYIYFARNKNNMCGVASYAQYVN